MNKALPWISSQLGLGELTKFYEFQTKWKKETEFVFHLICI